MVQTADSLHNTLADTKKVNHKLLTLAHQNISAKTQSDPSAFGEIKKKHQPLSGTGKTLHIPALCHDRRQLADHDRAVPFHCHQPMHARVVGGHKSWFGNWTTHTSYVQNLELH